MLTAHTEQFYYMRDQLSWESISLTNWGSQVRTLYPAPRCISQLSNKVVRAPPAYASTICSISLMAKQNLAKVQLRVRFSHIAPGSPQIPIENARGLSLVSFGGQKETVVTADITPATENYSMEKWILYIPALVQWKHATLWLLKERFESASKDHMPEQLSWLEHRIHIPKVAGSIPASGTKRQIQQNIRIKKHIFWEYKKLFIFLSC